jgi:aspartyl protease family protein
VSEGPQILLLAMMLILPLTALVARRPPLGATMKMVAAWVVIFGVAAVAMTQVDRLRGSGGDPAETRGQPVRIARDVDGHCWADARINGVARRMLVDSGATTTAISEATAKAAGIDTGESTFPRVIDTANGQVIARTARVARLTIGTIETRDLPVVVTAAFADQDLIGMNFLSRLGSWRVEDKTLILTPTKDNLT